MVQPVQANENEGPIVLNDWYGINFEKVVFTGSYNQEIGLFLFYKIKNAILDIFTMDGIKLRLQV